MTSFYLIVIIGLCQGFILTFFVLSSKHYRSIPNYWLSLFLVLVTVSSILDIIGSYYQTSSIIEEFFINDISYDFLLYVPLYYYFKTSVSESRKNVKPNYYLLFPFLVDTILNIVIVASYKKETIIENYTVQFFYNLESLASLLFILFLCYKSYKLIQGSSDFLNSKNWLFKIWKSSLILIILGVITISVYTWNEDLSIFIMLFYVVISLWLFWIIYNGVVNLNLINDRKDIREKINNHKKEVESRNATHQRENKEDTISIAYPDDSDKNETKTSGTDTLAKHFQKINMVMETKQLYRNEDLSLQDVASELGLSEGYISQIIRKTVQKNFTTWGNEFRVSDTERMLSDRNFSNYTILAIGLEAGFKSKSAFYASFKQITGLTPSQYRKKKS